MSTPLRALSHFALAPKLFASLSLLKLAPLSPLSTRPVEFLRLRPRPHRA
jgi:hypothetical protein